jgi:hypothetical protein
MARQELVDVSVDDPDAAGMIDTYYTEFSLEDSDRSYLERFLESSHLGVRREALLGLMFSAVSKELSYTGYALDGLILHLLGLLEDTDAQFTGAAVLGTLRNRGDKEAAKILDSLEKNKKWKRDFIELGAVSRKPRA